MTRTVALRASAIFIALTLVFGTAAFGSQAPLASALLLISASLCALTLLFAAAPHHAPMPARIVARRVRR